MDHIFKEFWNRLKYSICKHKTSKGKEIFFNIFFYQLKHQWGGREFWQLQVENVDRSWSYLGTSEDQVHLENGVGVKGYQHVWLWREAMPEGVILWPRYSISSWVILHFWRFREQNCSVWGGEAIHQGVSGGSFCLYFPLRCNPSRQKQVVTL